jgi:hypothetical protein
MAATPPAAHKAMTTPAPPTDRRSGTPNATGLLNISSSPSWRLNHLLKTKILLRRYYGLFGDFPRIYFGSTEIEGHFCDIVV